MSKTLYVSDIDGTLLSPDSKISDETRRLLNEAIREGACFTVATARTPATVSPLLKGVEMNLPACVMTGSALWNPATDEYSNICYIAEDEVRKAIDIYREASLPTFVYTLEEGVINMYHIGDLNELEYAFLEQRLHTPFKRPRVTLEDSDRLPEHLDKVILFFAIQPTEPAFEVYERLKRVMRSTLMYYHDTYGEEIALLEIFAEGSTKARAVRDLARAIGADRIVAFGDNLNDLPLLRAADVAVAVGNAVDEVKEVADCVIGSNADDSVPKAILANMRGLLDFGKSKQ